MAEFDVPAFEELAPGAPASTDNVTSPSYGRYLDDFNEGDVFIHPRAFTVDRSFAQEFATVFHETCPLFMSADYAKAHGFRDLVVPPLQVFNIVLSLGVQNNSEKAMANLGYYGVTFLEPVYPGDSITARSKVLSRRDRGEGKPGIVHVRTLGLNQENRPVIQYERKIMIPPRPADAPPAPASSGGDFPEVTNPKIQLPELSVPDAVRPLTGTDTYYEDFSEGQIIVHRNMRTITDEHMPWTYRMGNTHPLHYDKIYSMGLSGPMSGTPIVYGGLVFGWLMGMASRDTTENMVWDMGYHEGYHTQPAIAGDTVGAISRIIKKTDGPLPGTGMLQIQLIGVKNIKTQEALDQFGADLFIKENEKKKLEKEKIPAKIFEIERRVLLKKKG